MKPGKLIIQTVATAVVVGGCAFGQQPNPALPIGTLARSSVGTATPEFADLSSALITNRARVLGAQLSADGTRYFSVKDADLANKPPAEVVQRLSPGAMTDEQRLKHVETSVDLRAPLLIVTSGSAPVGIDVTTIQKPTHAVSVNNSISTNGITVVRK